MKLTPELLEQFIGGQMRLRNGHTDRQQVGRIRSISSYIEGFIIVHFEWSAEKLSNSAGWFKDQDMLYTLNVGSYVAQMIEPGEAGGGDRLRITNAVIPLTITFNPPDGDKVDPSEIEGLTLDSD